MQTPQVKVTFIWYIPSIVVPYVSKEVGSLSKVMGVPDFTAMMSTRSITLRHGGRALSLPIINSTTVFDAGGYEYVVKVRMPILKTMILGERIVKLMIETNGLSEVDEKEDRLIYA
jgi:hypothetical protein